MKNKNFAVGLTVAIVILVSSIYYLSNNGSTTTVTTTEQATTPEVVTASAVSFSGNNVIVNGSVNPKGAVTEYWYEYGKTPELGSLTPSQKTGPTFIIFLATDYIPNLSKNVTYYFRLVAENQYGKVEGNTFSFKMDK